MSDPIPLRFPATANDLATSVMRVLGQHLELGCRLVFDRRLDEAVLRTAVRSSLHAQPVLGCGLRTTFRTGWWERLHDLDDRVPFSITHTEDPDRDAVALQAGTIPDSGPQVFVGLLRAAGHDEVCFRITHNVADGQAVKQYAYLLGELYSRLMADPGYVPAPDLSPRPSGQGIWEHLPAEERRKARKEPRPVMPNWNLTRMAVSGAGRTIRELQVGPDRFRAIKEYGVKRGATVNDVALTAFFRAMTETVPPKPGKAMSLAFSADHRRYLRDVIALPIANLAITIWLGVLYDQDDTFEATLQRVTAQTARWREALWGARSAVRAARIVKVGYRPMEALMAAIGHMSGKSTRGSPIFTNLGILDERRLSFAGALPVSARLSGPAAWGASFVPTVSTYRDTMTVSMGFCADDTCESDIQAVLRAMDAQIDAIAAADEADPAARGGFGVAAGGGEDDRRGRA